MDIQKYLDLIDKWGISNAWLAKLIGMSRNSFYNKKTGIVPYAKFSEEEKLKLKSVLKELAKDIKEVK